MAKLIAQSATGSALPFEIGKALLEDAQPDAITWVAPFEGKEKDVAKQIGELPEPNRTCEVKGGQALWIGAGQALILGAPVTPKNAAYTDQSDGYTMVRLSGETAADILARLTPVDLRDAAFPEGATARTFVAHITVSLTRTGPYAYDILAFRSMTQTLIHDLTRAMTQVAARARL